MKNLILILVLTVSSVAAFAQFPLGADSGTIKAYFAQNVPYASAQDFKAEDGAKAICFTKVRVLGDYTFYFDNNEICTSYIVTYDKHELGDVTGRFDGKFCKVCPARWVSEDGSYEVTLIPSKGAENYFSIVYKPIHPSELLPLTLASN
jgi:hypothetical protein